MIVKQLDATPTPVDCCNGKESSVNVVNGQPIDLNNVTVSTGGKNTQDPVWDGTMCWETLPNKTGPNTIYFIELRDSESGPSVGFVLITIGIAYEGQSFNYTLNSNVIDILDCSLRRTVSGTTTDLQMSRVSRSEYLNIPNKATKIATIIPIVAAITPPPTPGPK